MQDVFGYQGKIAVVTGAAGTGMGATVAAKLGELGADVYALDRNEVTIPVKKSIMFDQGKQEEIKKAVGQLPSKIDCLFNCAGVPGVPFSNFDTMIINFVGLRYLTELLIPRIRPGGAIVNVSSTAGRSWQQKLDKIKELIETSGWNESVAWLNANKDVNRGYSFSKECLILYTKGRVEELAKKEIRMNCINPGATMTPMMTDYFEKYAPKGALDSAQGLTGRKASVDEIVDPMLFLNSNLARYVSGVHLFVDYGRTASREYVC